MKTLYPSREQSERPSEGLSVVSNEIPATLIVPLDEMKTYARVDATDDDDLITQLIKSATRLIEHHIGRALIERTIVVYYRQFKDYADLPFPPFVSLTSVEEEDSEGSYSAVTSYTLTGGGKWMRLKIPMQFSTTSLYVSGGIKVTYVAGYGSTEDDVPAEVKDALKDIVASAYDRRGEGVAMTEFAESLLSTLRIY